MLILYYVLIAITVIFICVILSLNTNLLLGYDKNYKFKSIINSLIFLAPVISASLIITWTTALKSDKVLNTNSKNDYFVLDEIKPRYNKEVRQHYDNRKVVPNYVIDEDLSYDEYIDRIIATDDEYAKVAKQFGYKSVKEYMLNLDKLILLDRIHNSFSDILNYRKLSREKRSELKEQQVEYIKMVENYFKSYLTKPRSKKEYNDIYWKIQAVRDDYQGESKEKRLSETKSLLKEVYGIESDKDIKRFLEEQGTKYEEDF